MRQQVQEQAGDGLVGGLAAGGQQQAAERLDVLIAHAGAVDLGGAQRGQQVVAEVVPPLPDHRQHVLGELLAGAHPRLGDLRVLAEVAEERDDRGVPAAEPRPVGVREPEHVRDDVDRELGGVVGDQVDPAGGAEGVDELAGIALDHRHELLLQLAAAERGGHQRAAHRVLAAVELQDGPAVHRLQLPVVVLGGEHRFPEGALDVLVAGDDVALRRFVPEQREFVAQDLVRRVGAVVEFRRKDVRGVAGRGHAAPSVVHSAQGT